MQEFTQHDWNHMHDCILHATWNTAKKKSTKEELVEIFNKLPEDMKEDAIKEYNCNNFIDIGSGMGDLVDVSDDIISIYGE